MEGSTFDVDVQNNDLASKITAGLERISLVFRSLLWEHAKTLGISPIQIQILIFVQHHPESLCTVSYLAQEFMVTKPTISDAVKVLHKKKMINKVPSILDRRAYTISLTEQGQDLVSQTESFAAPMRAISETLSPEEQRTFFAYIGRIIYDLNQNGILSVQRTCYACAHYKQKDGGDYCRLIGIPLKKEDIRLDCPEFEARDT